MFDAVGKFCNDYYNQIPDDGLKAAGLSAIYSFTASMIYIAWRTPINQMPNDLTRAGLAAGIAFVAAGIHAITTPIFNYFFSNPNNYLNCRMELIRNVCSISLTHILINQTKVFKINLITPRNLENPNFIMIPSTLVKVSFHMLGYMIAKLINSNAFNKNFPNQSPIYVTA